MTGERAIAIPDPPQDDSQPCRLGLGGCDGGAHRIGTLAAFRHGDPCGFGTQTAFPDIIQSGSVGFGAGLGGAGAAKIAFGAHRGGSLQLEGKKGPGGAGNRRAARSCQNQASCRFTAETRPLRPVSSS